MISRCRSCGKTNLKEVIDLGYQYLSDFREDDQKPPRYPLEAVICDSCKLVQLKETTPSKEMYHENYGFKSGVSDSIKADLKENVELGLKYKPEAKNWLDIASNDGTLLSFVPKNIYRVGVDPIKKLCKEAEQHADWIINGFFSTVPFQNYNSGDGRTQIDKFDIITAISCFYDLDDPNTFVSGVAEVLAPKGIWIIQQNYLMTTLKLGAVDNFCHEHIEYYTMLSLEALLGAHDLEIIQVQTSMVNGGSLRTVVAHRDAYPIDESVDKQIEEELAYGLNTMKPYLEFAEKAKKKLQELHDLIAGLAADGKKIYILAASTRGSTIWQGAHLDYREIGAAVERNEGKVGRFFSAVGVPIISEAQAHKDKPDAMLVGPWFFVFPEILNREREYIMAGGCLIIPLPEVITIDKYNIDYYENYKLN